MSPLTSRGLLEAWEWGQGRGPAARALALLALASPDLDWEELGALPLGERDRRLLALREELLGSRIDGLARCPACAEALDLVFDARELRSSQAAAPVEHQLSVEGLTVRFRPANSHDLLAAQSCSGIEEARRRIAERCVLEARREERSVPASELAEEELAALAGAMADADPGAELWIELECPACAHGWWELLDVATFLWIELEAQVRSLLRDIHLLARAYGWREADVLSLSPWRRRIYLEMVDA
jgi:hypothetical protein